MSSQPKASVANVIPCVRYRNAPAAIEWLERAFGFKAQLVVPGPAGAIVHAQLHFGKGMVMISSVMKNVFGPLMKQPDELDGAGTQLTYVIVSDADAVYAQARAAGAVVIAEIKDEDYGGRGFTCLDLEGHLWSFGTYDPWSNHAQS